MTMVPQIPLRNFQFPHRTTAEFSNTLDEEASIHGPRLPKDELLEALVLCSRTPSPADRVQEEWSWFLSNLETRFHTLPQEYGVIGSEGLSGTNITFAEFCRIAASICRDISQESHAALDEIAVNLQNCNLVTRDGAMSAKAMQLVFATFGLLSALFEPSSAFSEGMLLIQVPSLTLDRRRFSDTWAVSEQELQGENLSLSICDVLRRFSNARGPIPYFSHAPVQPIEVTTLTASNIWYFTLSKLGGLKIKWTDSACMHLELNKRNRTVTMFRFPSLCTILAQSENQQIFLDRLFIDYLNSLDGARGNGTPAIDFYYEILLSFRLIFGQNKRSWSLMKKQGGIPRPDNRCPNLAVDPLLFRLCCQDWEDEPIYDKIHAPDARSLYSAHQDFPFFGARLIALQEYTKNLEPTTLTSLFYDRRSMTKFCATWAAIYFGTLTLVVAILTLGLAIAEVYGSLK